jgi:trigger factor
MSTALTTSVESLDGNKIRLRVAVPEDEFDRAVDAAFRKLADEVRIDGFRKGKVPRKLLEARVGTGVARDQALRDALPDYYARAVRDNRLDTIAAPEIDITAGEDAGPVEFEAVVELRPQVSLDGYRGIRVELDVPSVDDAAIDRQIDTLRERFADLEDSAAPLTDGDYAEIDLKASIDGEPIGALSATDFLYEVGSGLVVTELDQELRGTRPGAILSFVAALPETAAEHAGDDADFQVLVKDAKRKILPEVTDDWACEVSEFDTVDALRADIAHRIQLVAKVQAQMVLRDRVLDAVADLVAIEVPEALTARELEHRVRDIAERLASQGATIDQYLAASGRDREQFLAELREGATRAARADLALRAVVAQEGIEATDAEVDAEIERLAEQYEQQPAELRKELDQRGVVEALRSDLARGMALRFLVDHAEVVDTEGSPLDLSIPEPDIDESDENPGMTRDDSEESE